MCDIKYLKTKIMRSKMMTAINEYWKDIDNYEGYYKISNLGRVKSLERQIKTSNDYYRTISGKILNPSLNGEGYQQVTLSVDGVKTNNMVHHLVAKAFLNHSTKGNSIVIDHMNDNPTDNRVSNLNIVTNRENLSRMGGTSKYVGVNWDKRTKKWRSQINIDGKGYHIGLFIDEIEAANAYQKVLNDIELFLESKLNIKRAA